MIAANKVGNEYQALLGDLYAKAPKAVLAAMVVDLLALCSGEAETFIADPSRVRHEAHATWDALHEAGIVPQKAPNL